MSPLKRWWLGVRGPVIVVGVSVGAGVIIGLVIASRTGRTEVRA